MTMTFTTREPETEEYNGLRLETNEYEGPAGEPRYSLRMWRGAAKRPFAHFYWTSLERREEYIGKAKVAQDALVAAKAKRRQDIKDKTKAFRDQLKVGDVFYSSWGYDQTNVSFYQIVKLSKTKATATFKEIGGNIVENGWASGDITAVKDSFLDRPEFKRVVQDGYVKIDRCEHAWLDDGRSHYKSWYA